MSQELYDRALAVDNKNQHLKNSLAQFLRQLGRVDEAKEILNDLLKDVPACGVSWNILGELYVEEGAHGEARECFQKGIQTKRPILFLFSCLAFFKVQKEKEFCFAWKDWQDWNLFLGISTKQKRFIILQKRNTISHPGFIEAGRILKRNMGVGISHESFIQRLMNPIHKQALENFLYESFTKDTKALLQWGLHERRCGNIKQAESCFLKGLKFDEQNVYFWYSYAQMYIRLGEVNKAKEVLDNALTSCPK